MKIASTIQFLKQSTPILLLLLIGLILGLGADSFSGLILFFIALGVALVVFYYHPSLLVITLAFLIPFQINYEILSLNSANLSPQTLGAVGLILFIVLFSMLSKSIQFRFFRTPYLFIWLTFIVISSIGIALGPLITSGFQGIWAVYRIVFSSAIIYIGVWIFLYSQDFVMKAMQWLCIGASIGSLIAIMQTITQGNVFSGLMTNYRYLGLFVPIPQNIIADYTNELSIKLFLANTNLFRGHGTFYSSNGFGMLLATTIFLTMGCLAYSQRKRRWLWYAFLLIQLGGLIITFSRSAWAGTAAGFIVWVLLTIRINPKKLSIVIILSILLIFVLTAGLIGGIVFTDLSSHFLTIFSPSNVPEFFWRLMVWDFALTEIIDNPFIGTGTSDIDNSIAQIPGSGPIENFSTHNIFIDIAYQRGLIVFMIYIFFWVIIFWNLWKLNRFTINTRVSSLSISIFAAGVAFLVSGIGSAAMVNENLATLFWFMLGVVVVLKSTEMHQNSNTHVVRTIF